MIPIKQKQNNIVNHIENRQTSAPYTLTNTDPYLIESESESSILEQYPKPNTLPENQIFFPFLCHSDFLKNLLGTFPPNNLFSPVSISSSSDSIDSNEDLSKKSLLKKGEILNNKFLKDSSKKLKRKLSQTDDNDNKWPMPMLLGSFIQKTPYSDLRIFSKFNLSSQPEIDIFSLWIEDSITKNQKDSLNHKIAKESLKTYLRYNGNDIELTHFCSQIWTFLLNFRLIDMKAQVLNEIQERIDCFIFFKIDVYLKDNVTMKFFNIEKTISTSKFLIKAMDEEWKTFRKLELMKYCKESLIILFDMLKIKKTKNSLVEIKRKIALLKKFTLNHQSYPDLVVKKANLSYYTNHISPSKHEYQILPNRSSRIFDQEDDNILNLYSIFPEENNKKMNLNNEKTKEFLHFMNSNDFRPQNTPENMVTPLHEYQQQALSWFLYREEVINDNDLYLNSEQIPQKMNPFWEEYEMIDKTQIYFNIFTGEISNDSPKTNRTKGGILADEMGLGKTLMALALIHANKPKNVKKFNRLKPLSQKKLKTEEKKTITLIIVPLSILEQWKNEILQHSRYKTLRVGQYYGNLRRSFKISQYDVILMTYDGVVQEYKQNIKDKNSLIFQYSWYRVILDEAHCIKNHKSLRNEACCALNAQFRWCLTGTPIHNHLDDLFSLLKFLKVEVLGEEYSYWNTYINNSQDFLGILRQIVGPLLLRRTKNSVDGKGLAILTLPDKIMKVIHVEMFEEERKAYENLYEKSRKEFLFFLKNGSALKNYTGIFAMIMRLRQCCDHPSLVYKPIGKKEFENELKNFLVKPEKAIEIFSGEEEEEIQMTSFQKNSIPEIIEMIQNNKFSNCPICLSDMIEASLTKCCHIACNECLKKTIKFTGLCPICRNRISLTDICKICRFFIFFKKI